MEIKILDDIFQAKQQQTKYIVYQSRALEAGIENVNKRTPIPFR